MRLGDYPGAVRDFSRAISLDPEDHQFYQHRAVAYEGLGFYNKAKSDRKRAWALETRPVK